MLAGAAVGCSGAEPGPDGQASLPGEEGFDYAPSAEVASDKDAESAELSAKGSASRVYGPAYTIPVTIANGASVSYSTSGGSDTQDPVLVLFKRHDNSTNFGSPYTQRPGLLTLAVNDDTNFRDAAISYTNNTGTTLNARLMVFAWADRIGQVTLSGTGLTTGLVSSGGADPWLFTFDVTPGQGNGAWNDDDPAGSTYESRISGATSLEMWYVAHQYSSSTGTTTINF
jgi:hypothetical protein